MFNFKQERPGRSSFGKASFAFLVEAFQCRTLSPKTAVEVQSAEKLESMSSPLSGSNKFHCEPATFTSISSSAHGRPRNKVNSCRVLDLTFALAPEEHENKADGH